MMESSLFSALDSIVSVKDRVYPLSAPRDCTVPYVTYQVIHEGTGQCMNAEIYDRQFFVQVDVWSKDYDELKVIKDEVFAKIVALEGADLSARDLYEPETKLHRQLIEFNIKG